MNGRQPSPTPLVTNTCYSFVSDKEVVHVASVHTYDPKDKTFKTVPGSGGGSPRRNEIEGVYGWGRGAEGEKKKGGVGGGGVGEKDGGGYAGLNPNIPSRRAG